MPAYQYIYVMKGLGKTYPGGREVLKDIWLSFLPGAKIGVLGANGAGKSTLLRIMAGEERDFAGEAWAAEGARVGYLPQEPALDRDQGRVRQRHRGAGRDQGAARPLRGGQRALCRGAVARRDGRADRRAGRIAGKDRPGRRLGARPHRSRSRWTRCAARRATPRSRPCRAASGAASRCAGCCCSAPICCCSTSRPTISTPNRSPGCSASSKDYPGTVVTVTHDRYFLDEVAGWILELDRGRGIPYEGNYSGWLEQKQAAARAGGTPGGGAPAHPGARARMGAAEPARAPGEEQGAPLGLRGAGRRRAARRRRRPRRSCCRRDRGSAIS